MGLMKNLLKNIFRPDCHTRLECALREAKARGMAIDPKRVARELMEGPHARPSTR